MSCLDLLFQLLRPSFVREYSGHIHGAEGKHHCPQDQDCNQEYQGRRSRIVVRIGGSKKSEESVLDQLPSVVNGTITNGSAEIVLQGSRQTIIVQSGNITVRDFSPEHGGKVVFSGGVNYELDDKNKIGLNGSATASLDITAFKPALCRNGHFDRCYRPWIAWPVFFSSSVSKGSLLIARR